jgi:hypothetical protein
MIIFDFADVRILPLTPPPPCVRSCPLLADPPPPFGADVLYGWPLIDNISRFHKLIKRIIAAHDRFRSQRFYSQFNILISIEAITIT